MNNEERFEQLLAFLGSQLPKPVDQQEAEDGSVVFMAGEPVEVVVRLTDTNVVVSEFDGVWKTSFHFAVKPRRVGVLKWRRLPETELMNALAALIKGARHARLARYQVCAFCGQTTAPELLHDEKMCESCAERNRGLIH